MKPGSYALDSRVVVQWREGDPLHIEELMLGLFAGPPSPEGAGGLELCAAGYARQPVEFNFLNGRSARNARAVSFRGVPEWPEARYAAIFMRDALLASGRMKKCAGFAEHDEALFPVASIQLRIR